MLSLHATFGSKLQHWRLKDIFNPNWHNSSGSPMLLLEEFYKDTSSLAKLGRKGQIYLVHGKSRLKYNTT